jgi:hypothetical protein
MRTDFAILETQRIAVRMGAVLPEDYRPARTVNGRTRTCRWIEIGCAHQRPAAVITVDGEQLQSALLEPKTAKPLPLLQRFAGAMLRWC